MGSICRSHFDEESQIGGRYFVFGHEVWQFDAAASDTHSDGSGSRDFSFDSPVHHHPAAWTKQRGGACLVSMNIPCSFIIRIYLILIFSIDVLIFLPSSRL